MVVINMEIPKGCQHCKFFRKHAFGNGLDYSYSCDLGATNFPMPWIRQMEERAKDCPLIEIGTCKDCKHRTAIYADGDCFCEKDELLKPNMFYCADFEKRGDGNVRKM